MGIVCVVLPLLNINSMILCYRYIMVLCSDVARTIIVWTHQMIYSADCWSWNTIPVLLWFMHRVVH